MELESRPSRHRRRLRKARVFWSAACLFLTLLSVAFYLLWGFRWPPTAELLVHGDSVASGAVAGTAHAGPARRG
jgi:hypothetical protein